MNIEFKKVRKDTDYRYWVRKAPIVTRQCFIKIKNLQLCILKRFLELKSLCVIWF